MRAMMFGALVVLLPLIAAVGYALIWAPKLPRKWEIGLSVVGGAMFLLCASMLALRGAALEVFPRWLVKAALTVLPVFLYLALGALVFGLASAVWALVDHLHGVKPLLDGVPSLRIKCLRVAVAALTAVAVAAVGYGYQAAKHPTLTQTEFASSELPAAFDGYRIALITDIHLGPGISGEWVKREIVDQVNAADVDLVVIGGDFVDGTVDELGDEMAVISELRARDGVVGVTGNHEFYTGVAQQWVDYFDAHGITMLDNDGIVLTRGDESIDVLGVNDLNGSGPLKSDFVLASERTAAKSGQGTEHRFRILVAHQPRQAVVAAEPADPPSSQPQTVAEVGVDLQLSGHTHGGQIWPIHYLAVAQQGMLAGTAELGGVTVITSRGAGAWGPPVRIAASPEIPIITLRTA